MNIKTNYQVVNERYPNHVEEAIADLRKGKSKCRNDDPSKMEWFFTVGVQGKAMTFDDVMQEIVSGFKPKRPNTADEWWEGVKNNYMVCVSLKTASGWMYNSELLEEVPKEVEMKSKSDWDRSNKRMNEDNRSEEELISELSKYPGFSVFKI